MIRDNQLNVHRKGNYYLKDDCFGDVYNGPSVLWGRIKNREETTGSGFVFTPDHKCVAYWEFAGGLHVVISNKERTVKRMITHRGFARRPWVVHYANDKPRYFKAFKSMLNHVLSIKE